MTITEIEAQRAREAVKFDLARQIRELLDVAKKSYGAAAWDEDEVETAVIELVTEE